MLFVLLVFMLDQADLHILEFLKENSRMPFLAISKRLHVSESMVRKRVKKLHASGIIKGFTINLDRRLAFESIVAIKCRPKATKTIAKKIQEMEKLVPIFEVTGRFDVFCILSAPTARELNKKIDKIRESAGVTETESFMVIEKK